MAAPKARQTLSADARPPGVETGWMNRIFAQSHERLEWTGRQVRVGRVVRIPADETSLRNRLGVAIESWRKRVASVHTKQGGPRRVSGRPAALEAEAGKRGRRGIEGVALSREIFVKRQAIAHPRPTAALTRAVRHEFDSAIGPSSRDAARRTRDIC